MADDTQQLVYKINVITEGVQGKVADVTNELNRVKTTVDAIGKSQLQVNTTKALDEFESLNSMLREVRRGIELLTRNNNAQIIDLNGLPQTMTSLRLLEMQIQDLQKSIKAASLNEIFKSNQKQQINEVTSALQSQRKAIDDITKSMEQQKAMSQSTYYRRRSDFDSANATLGNSMLHRRITHTEVHGLTMLNRCRPLERSESALKRTLQNRSQQGRQGLPLN